MSTTDVIGFLAVMAVIGGMLTYPLRTLACSTIVVALLITKLLTGYGASPLKTVPPAPSSWADAGRALSAYSAKHREVHALLRSRATENAQAPTAQDFRP